MDVDVGNKLPLEYFYPMRLLTSRAKKAHREETYVWKFTLVADSSAL